MPQIVESIGGSSRMITLLTLVIHFVHPLLCIANYLDWVRHQSGDDALGERIVIAYLAMSIIATLFYLLVSSVFYMWAWRYPEPEEIAKRRRIYGVFTNLFFSDLPIFLVEVSIVWSVGAATGLQITSFVFTCISMLYSGLRVWTFLMVKVIKVRAPQPGPSVAGARMFDAPPGARGPAAYGGSPDGRDGGAGGVVPPSGMYSPGARY
uniref:Transmembrane protein n=1 Tax=Neobodo designis TaxID=312471 RepID=A0A7S1W6N0_NEODS|mmetsp:Transcript_54707/g.168496  ORF Transcript_54707/g.168496 Transcript_54707/m.168496 type:complete len:208 (+) Transcript_54707:26-649(+)